MLIVNAEIEGIAPLDLRIAGDRIAEVGRGLAAANGERVLDANGGALLPGLHDHHLHLFALAVAEASVRCGPPQVESRDALAEALQRAHTGTDGWIRGVGYHESVAGELDRTRLDRLAPDRPLRIQHRSGALWMLNSRAVECLGLDRESGPSGVERDPTGRPTGRLFRLDDWLRLRLDRDTPPDLSDVSLRLASYGVTGLTDATARNSRDELREFVTALERSQLRQRVVLMGSDDLPASHHPLLQRGARKILLDENDLPSFEALRHLIASAHQQGRPVAIHCVTRSELVLSAAVLEDAGCLPGDRIEHASVTPPDALELLAGLPLSVVTQPGFVRERGDAYLVEVDPQDRPWLYRCQSFLQARIPLGGSTDAPFGDPDPWRAMRSAVERRTETGQCIGSEEALTPEQALALFTTSAERPGGPPRSLTVGARADLCLLDCSWTSARQALSSERVAATLRAGSLIWARAELAGPDPEVRRASECS